MSGEAEDLRFAVSGSDLDTSVSAVNLLFCILSSSPHFHPKAIPGHLVVIDEFVIFGACTPAIKNFVRAKSRGIFCKRRRNAEKKAKKTWLRLADTRHPDFCSHSPGISVFARY